MSTTAATARPVRLLQFGKPYTATSTTTTIFPRLLEAIPFRHPVVKSAAAQALFKTTDAQAQIFKFVDQHVKEGLRLMTPETPCFLIRNGGDYLFPEKGPDNLGQLETEFANVFELMQQVSKEPDAAIVSFGHTAGRSVTVASSVSPEAVNHRSVTAWLSIMGELDPKGKGAEYGFDSNQMILGFHVAPIRHSFLDTAYWGVPIPGLIKTSELRG